MNIHVIITEITWEIVSSCSKTAPPRLGLVSPRSKPDDPYSEFNRVCSELSKSCSKNPEIDAMYRLLEMTQPDDASDERLGLPNETARDYRKNIAIPRYLAAKKNRDWKRKIHPSRSVAAQKRERNRGKFQSSKFVPVPQVHSKTTAQSLRK